MRLWLTRTSNRRSDRSVGWPASTLGARWPEAESPNRDWDDGPRWLRFVRNRIVPIDAAVRAPSPEPEISGRAFVSELRVDLSAASTRPGKRRPAASAAGIELMHLEELRVRGQAHPRSPLRPLCVQGAQFSMRPPALMFLATARPAASSARQLNDPPAPTIPPSCANSSAPATPLHATPLAEAVAQTLDRPVLVIPAKAGIQSWTRYGEWIPAFAGMTKMGFLQQPQQAAEKGPHAPCFPCLGARSHNLTR